MRRRELTEFNAQVTVTGEKEHKFFFPGFFNSNHILFVGICPNMPTSKKFEDDMIDVSNNKELYEDRLMETPLGEYILSLTNSTKHISYTNLIKHATTAYRQVPREQIEKYKDILQNQIKLLQPNLVVLLGDFTSAKFGITDPYEFKKIEDTYYVKIPHHGKVNRQDLCTQISTVKKIKDVLNSWFKTHAIIRVTNYNIYYRDIQFLKQSYPNTTKDDFCFIRTENESEYKSFDGYNLQLVKKRQISGHQMTYEAHLKKKDLWYYTRIGNIQHSKCLRLCAYDIETDMCNDVEATPKPVISIACYDNISDKYYQLIYNKYKHKITVNPQNCKVVEFDSEVQMLRYFFNKLKHFDVITAWYGNHFDLPYLINRCKLLNIDLRDYMEYAFPVNDKNRWIVKMEPIIEFDARVFYQKMVYVNKPPSFSLNDVAMFLFEEEKIKPEGMSIDQMWRKDCNALIEYNIQDTYLLKKICDEINLLSYPISLQQLCPQNFENALYNSKTIENKLHHNYWKKKVFFPTKVKHDKKDITGAAVVKPIAGTHKHVVVLDFASMYTNIYLSMNVSPDTLVGEKNQVHTQFIQIKNNLIKRYPELQKKFEEFDHDRDKILKDWVLIETDFGEYYFLSKDWKHGILPKLEEEMFSLRRYYKKERDKYESGSVNYKIYDDLQGTAKEILNSIYGVTSFDRFILFSQVVSAAITSFGRKMVEFVLSFSQQKGFPPLYGDTDSIFISFDKFDTFEEVVEAAKQFEKELNEALVDYMKQFTSNKHMIESHSHEIEYEKIYSKLLLTDAKKKYFGRMQFYKGKILDPYKMTVTGFETRRDDTPKYFKPVLMKTYELLLEDNYRESIIEYYKHVKKEVYQMTPMDLLIKKKKGKEFSDYTSLPQHMRALQNSNTDIDRGEPVNMIYVKGSKEVIHYDKNLNQKFQLDYEKYLEMFFRRKIELIHPEFDKLFVGQKTLDAFT